MKKYWIALLIIALLVAIDILCLEHQIIEYETGLNIFYGLLGAGILSLIGLVYKASKDEM